MAAIQELTSLAERKQQLILECEIHRQVFTLELEMLKMRCGRARSGLKALPKVGAWALPLMGFLLGGRLKRGAWFFTKGTFKLMALVKALRLVKRVFSTHD